MVHVTETRRIIIPCTSRDRNGTEDDFLVPSGHFNVIVSLVRVVISRIHIILFTVIQAEAGLRVMNFSKVNDRLCRVSGSFPLVLVIRRLHERITILVAEERIIFRVSVPLLGSGKKKGLCLHCVAGYLRSAAEIVLV